MTYISFKRWCLAEATLITGNMASEIGLCGHCGWCHPNPPILSPFVPLAPPWLQRYSSEKMRSKEISG